MGAILGVLRAADRLKQGLGEEHAKIRAQFTVIFTVMLTAVPCRFPRPRSPVLRAGLDPNWHPMVSV